MFKEPDGDVLTFQLKSTTTYKWLQFSTFNASFFGFVNSTTNEPILMTLEARDPMMATCKIDIEFRVSTSSVNSSVWLWRIGIAVALVVGVAMAMMVIHCIFIGGKWQAILSKYLLRKQRIESVQHKINMQRYKNSRKAKIQNKAK